MGGALISLVANGIQDAYLTANPQITYFKVVYRRYTNFAMDAIEHPIDQTRPGGSYNVVMQRNGDLASRVALKVTLQSITTNGVGKVAWVRRLGHFIIDTVELKVGNTTIDKQYGMWMDLFYELTHEASNDMGYRKLIGGDS